MKDADIDETREARRVQVVAPQHPDQLTARRQRRGQTRDEGGAGRGDLQLQPLADEFMPAAQRQATARQAPVQARIAEGDDLGVRPGVALQSGDLGAQGGQAGVGRGHVGPGLKVLFLF